MAKEKKKSLIGTDMGEGNIRKWMFTLAAPAVAAQIINLLYNIVDRIYIGHLPEVGAAALTGVGLFTPILMLLTAFAMLCGSGGPPRAAISMGQKNPGAAQKIMGNCFSALIIMAAILTVVLYIFAPALLKLFGASDVVLPYALSYARIYIIGTIFVLIVMGMNPFITAQGFANFSMLTTVIGAVLNIILDPILIYACNMGVKGAAAATVISQGVSAVWVLKFLTGRRANIKLKIKDMKLIQKIIGPCLALGISAFVMTGTESILSVSFTSSLSRYGGDIAVGAMTIITSVNMLITMPLNGLGQGAQPLISFNFGAEKNDRVRHAFRLQFAAGVAYTTVFWLCLMIMPKVFVSIFSSDTDLVSYASWAMRIYMAGIFALGFQFSCQQCFVDLGQAKTSLLLACLRKLILLIPLIFILPHFISNKVLAVFLAEPISDILAASITVITFLTQFKKILERGPAKKQEIKRTTAC